jgi:hypothetical protein
VTTIKLVLHDLLMEAAMPLEQAIDRHFGPQYRQRTNGSWDDRAAFAKHIAYLRGIVESATVEVLDELTDGHLHADRHIVDIRKRDGGRVVQEVYLFGELDSEGRFVRIEETTLMLTGTEEDRGLGNAR